MPAYPITLALDTAQACCQCALIDADGAIYEMSQPLSRGHAEYLFDQIDSLLDNAQRDYDDIERIVVTVGPGSFTGLRVGLAAARGLAVALDVPCLGVSTLVALSLSGTDGGAFSVLMDARRNQHYRQDFTAPAQALSTPQALDNDIALESLSKNSAVLGSGAAWAAEQVGAKNLEAQRTAEMRGIVDVAKLAEFGQTADPQAFPPEPCYVREADAKPQTKKRIERI